MGKRAQKRAAKGWKNLTTHRPTKRPDTAGRCRKQVVAVMDDGSWLVFPYIGPAAQWVGGRRENVGRCCRSNQAKAVLRNPHGKPTGRVNTDHRYIVVTPQKARRGFDEWQQLMKGKAGQQFKKAIEEETGKATE